MRCLGSSLNASSAMPASRHTRSMRDSRSARRSSCTAGGACTAGARRLPAGAVERSLTGRGLVMVHKAAACRLLSAHARSSHHRPPSLLQGSAAHRVSSNARGYLRMGTAAQEEWRVTHIHDTPIQAAVNAKLRCALQPKWHGSLRGRVTPTHDDPVQTNMLRCGISPAMLILCALQPKRSGG